jgi:hypothetical protein
VEILYISYTRILHHPPQVQQTAGNPGGTKKAMRAQRTKLLFQFKKKNYPCGKMMSGP